MHSNNQLIDDLVAIEKQIRNIDAELYDRYRPKYERVADNIDYVLKLLENIIVDLEDKNCV